MQLSQTFPSLSITQESSFCAVFELWACTRIELVTTRTLKEEHITKQVSQELLKDI